MAGFVGGGVYRGGEEHHSPSGIVKRGRALPRRQETQQIREQGKAGAASGLPGE